MSEASVEAKQANDLRRPATEAKMAEFGWTRSMDGYEDALVRCNDNPDGETEEEKNEFVNEQLRLANNQPPINQASNGSSAGNGSGGTGSGGTGSVGNGSGGTGSSASTATSMDVKGVEWLPRNRRTVPLLILGGAEPPEKKGGARQDRKINMSAYLGLTTSYDPQYKKRPHRVLSGTHTPVFNPTEADLDNFCRKKAESLVDEFKDLISKFKKKSNAIVGDIKDSKERKSQKYDVKYERVQLAGMAHQLQYLKRAIRTYAYYVDQPVDSDGYVRRKDEPDSKIMHEVDMNISAANKSTGRTIAGHLAELSYWTAFNRYELQKKLIAHEVKYKGKELSAHGIECHFLGDLLHAIHDDVLESGEYLKLSHPGSIIRALKAMSYLLIVHKIAKTPPTFYMGALASLGRCELTALADLNHTDSVNYLKNTMGWKEVFDREYADIVIDQRKQTSVTKEDGFQVTHGKTGRIRLECSGNLIAKCIGLNEIKFRKTEGKGIEVYSKGVDTKAFVYGHVIQGDEFKAAVDAAQKERSLLKTLADFKTYQNDDYWRNLPHMTELKAFVGSGDEASLARLAAIVHEDEAAIKNVALLSDLYSKQGEEVRILSDATAQSNAMTAAGVSLLAAETNVLAVDTKIHAGNNKDILGDTCNTFKGDPQGKALIAAVKAQTKTKAASYKIHQANLKINQKNVERDQKKLKDLVQDAADLILATRVFCLLNSTYRDKPKSIAAVLRGPVLEKWRHFADVLLNAGEYPFLQLGGADPRNGIRLSEPDRATFKACRQAYPVALEEKVRERWTLYELYGDFGISNIYDKMEEKLESLRQKHHTALKHQGTVANGTSRLATAQSLYDMDSGTYHTRDFKYKAVQ